MNIAFDVQALQTTTSRQRGVGRYAYHLLEALLREPGPHRYLLVGNARLEPPDLTGLGKASYVALPYPPRDEAASRALQRTLLLAEGVDVFHILSPFEEQGYVEAFENFPCFVTSMLYDLIPLLFSERCLVDEGARAWYDGRLEAMKACDHVFAISESARQDAIEHLGLAPEAVTTVFAGIDHRRFHPLSDEEKPAWRSALAEQFGLTGRFVLTVGGGDFRKRMEDFLEAFARLATATRAEAQAVIACRLQAHEAAALRRLARRLGILERLVITGFVSDQALRALYGLCDAFVFPSAYEGFGLPPAEAMACGAPVITTNASSLPEVVGQAGLMVDVGDVAALSRALEDVLGSEPRRRRMSSEGRALAEGYTWERVAGRVAAYYEGLGWTSRAAYGFHRPAAEPSRLPRLAWFSPVSPVGSGISDYTEELLPFLGEHFDLHVYHDPAVEPTHEAVRAMGRPYTPEAFERALAVEGYHALVYQVGNSAPHAYMLEPLMRHGGIVTLHDYGLGGLVSWLASEANPDALSRVDLAAELAHDVGRRRAKEAVAALDRGRWSPHTLSEQGIYLNRRIVERALGVAVHSGWALEQARADHGPQPPALLARIPHGVPRPDDRPPSGERRRQAAILPDRFLVGMFGIVSANKGIDEAIAAVLELARSLPVHLVVVGEGHEAARLRWGGDRLDGHVTFTGRVEMAAFYGWMAECDAVLNLRYPTGGETSGALLRALSLGKPVVVNDGGAFGDFPDDVVWKLPYAPHESGRILEALRRLGGDRAAAARLGARARAYAEEHHALRLAAKAYRDFILGVMAHPHARAQLLADFAGNQLGASAHSAAGRQAAQAMAAMIARLASPSG